MAMILIFLTLVPPVLIAQRAVRKWVISMMFILRYGMDMILLLGSEWLVMFIAIEHIYVTSLVMLH